MLEARNLTKMYGKRQALNQLNLSVDKGEIFYQTIIKPLK